MKTFDLKPGFKQLFLFIVAAISLAISGQILSHFNLIHAIIHVNTITFGVILVYRLNHIFQAEGAIKSNIIAFLKVPLHFISLLSILLFSFPFYLINYQLEIIVLISIGALLGAIYALPITINNYTFRLKKVLFIKNILIGFVWALLVLIGAYPELNNEVVYLFGFVFIQVFIGSIIRDMPDINNDMNVRVNTLPNRFGRLKTLYALYAINTLVAIMAFILHVPNSIQLLIYFVFILRTINLIGLGHGSNHIFWTEVYNLNICTTILFLILILK